MNCPSSPFRHSFGRLFAALFAFGRVVPGENRGPAAERGEAQLTLWTAASVWSADECEDPRPIEFDCREYEVQSENQTLRRHCDAPALG